MTRPAAPLTDRRIRQVKPAATPIKLADGGGMYLLLRPDGARYWRLDYRFDGKRKTLALGVYPEVSLSEARKRRRAAKAILAQGRDPGAEKQALKAGRKSSACDGRDYALATLGDGVWDWELSSGRVRHNAQWARLMGLDAVRSEHAWQEAAGCLYEDDREAVMAAVQDCLLGKAAFACAHRIRRADGSLVWMQNHGDVVERDPDGKPLRMVGSLREIADRNHEALPMQRRNQLLQTIASVSEWLMADLPEQELMARICQALIRDDVFRMAWIGRVDPNGTTVRPLAEAGFVQDSLARAEIRCDDSPQGRGPTGIAIRTDATVISNDTETDPAFAPWRERARGLGYRSSAATPLRAHGRVIGALNVYAAEPDAFGPDQVILLEKLATDLGVAIGHRAALAALRESEERFRLISSVATDLLYSCRQAEGGFFAIDWATTSIDRIFGYSLDEILRRGCWRCFVHPDDLPGFDRNITHLAAGQRSECELRIVARDGSTRHIRAYSIVTATADGGCRLFGACQDITERKQAVEALRESEGRFRAMAEHSADWIWVINTEGRHLYSNPRFIASIGYTMEAFLALDFTALLHPDDLPRLRELLGNAVTSRQGWRNAVLRWRHRDGSYRILESNASAMFDEAGELIGFQGVDRDITERRQAEAQIEYLAHHDALTGLPNRVLLRDRFEHAVAVADRSRTRVAMLFLDLDNFKNVNDTLGHAAGDTLLLEVVARLSGCTRESDTISRQGGDEFILLLQGVPEQETVERIAGEILSQLAEPVEVNGHVMNASCSIGIALYPDDGGDFDSLLQQADTAMYSAKDAGRNTFRFYDEQMNRQVREHLLLQNRLHQGLFRSEFYLQYQPQLEVASGRVIGVEALLRWKNPDLGEVVPARFIPVAEDSGLIVQIGAWVLEEACRQGQALRQAGWPDLTMSVNLSALQFRRAGLVKTVAGALDRSGLPPQLLELELTESVLLQDVDNNLETVRQLKALGVRLSIDDFGTGYSSLSYLKRFAVDKLKIDRSFVRDISTDPDDAAIVRAVIQLARSLRLGIIAEGVETQEQWAFLREEGCREVQGFLFSRPLSLTALRIFLHQPPAFPGRAGARPAPR